MRALPDVDPFDAPPRSPHSLNVISHESAVGLVRTALADGVNVEEVWWPDFPSPRAVICARVRLCVHACVCQRLFCACA